jgi:3-hydroxyisobutyrate dehydrogenase
MRYGFVGLGNLGGHLAANLIAKGFAVTVCDQDRERAARHLEGGASFAKAPAELVASCDAIITCLPSPPQARAPSPRRATP